MGNRTQFAMFNFLPSANDDYKSISIIWELNILNNVVLS